MAKRSIFALLMFLFSVSVLVTTVRAAYQLADSNDVFVVNYPAPNQKVSGSSQITWRMYDDDQSVVQYTAKLFDAATCKSTSYGIINSNLNGLSSNTQDNRLNWNTSATRSTTNLQDGNYCLQLCAAMKNGTAPYSACNSRIVNIVNTNRFPVITSVPTSLTVKDTDGWSYQVGATDPDNDSLEYSLIYSTNFLSINPQTGLITLDQALQKLAPGVARADYTIMLGVDDKISGRATQEFTLTVVRDEETPTPGETNTPTEITIVKPASADVFKSSGNVVEWSVADPDGITKVTLNYSSDGRMWNELAVFEGEETSTTTYSWDVSELIDGSYYLQVVVVDAKEAQVSRTSNQFTIQNNEEIFPGSVPLIVNTQPENDTVTSDTTPVIEGEFVPSVDSVVLPETFAISLNEVDIKDFCTLEDNSFSCLVLEDLAEGRHVIKASVSDTSGQVASLSWSFSIGDETTIIDESASADTIVILGTELPRTTLILIVAVLILVVILIFVPWILIATFRKRSQRSDGGRTTSTKLEDVATAPDTFDDLTPTYSPPAPKLPEPPMPGSEIVVPEEQDVVPSPSQLIDQPEPQPSLQDFVEPEPLNNVEEPATEEPQAQQTSPASPQANTGGDDQEENPQDVII